MDRVDAPGKLQFTLKPGQILRVLRICLAQQLEGDDLPGLLVARLPDDTHAATAQLSEKSEALSHGVYNSTDARAVSPSLVPPVIRTR